MRWLTLPVLLAAALFSAVVVIPFLPVAKQRSNLFALEVTAASSNSGFIQLYFDDGTGFSEAASSRAPLPRSAAPVLCRLALPAGEYRALRLDPLDRDGTVTISSLRLIGPRGRILQTFPLSTLAPLNQIGSIIKRPGAVEIQIVPGANDPQLRIELAGPVTAAPSAADLYAGFWTRALAVFIALLALVAVAHVPSVRKSTTRLWQWAVVRERRALVLIAAVAVVLSSYPVVFLGASFVSPNLGTTLLYDEFPTLPGYRDSRTVDVNGSDIGAIMWQDVPFSMIQHRALGERELPVWNRYSAGGVPLLGQGQSMFGDPLHFLVVAANGAAWAWDLKFLVAKWLFALGLGLLVLNIARHLPAAALVTLAAPFVGFFVYRVNHPAFFSLCYSPWVLLCWVRAAEAPTRRLTAWWIAGLMLANFTLMNSGTVKEAYMLLFSLNLSGVCVLLGGTAPRAVRLGKLLGFAWAGVLFLLLSAPIWLTFLQELRQSYTSYNAVSAFQIQPSLLLGLFDETFYRPLMAEQRTFNPSLNFLLLLGFLYFLATLRASFRNRAALAIALSSLVPLAFAFGIVPPRWIVQWPFLANVAHLDNSFSCVLIVLWSVLAGVGFTRAAVRLPTRDGISDLIVVALLLGGMVAAWIGYGQAVHRAVFGAGTTFTGLQPGQSLPISPFVWGYLAALLLAALVLLWGARQALLHRSRSIALGLVLALAVVVMLWRQGQQALAIGYDPFVFRPTLRVDFHASSPAVDFVRRRVATEPARGTGFHGNFFPGWTAVYGLETIHGPDALANPYWRELTGALPGIQRIWDWRLYLDPANAGIARPYLDTLNVRYYFDLRSDQGLLGQPLHLLESGDLDVYESPTAWPRAFFTDTALTYRSVGDYVHAIGSGDGRPFAAVQENDAAAEDAVAILRHDLGGRTLVPATHYALTENTTAFDVHASGPGLIVVNQAFWPGDFRADVNGRKTPIFRVNHALQGLAVRRAGDYHVMIRCVPQGFPRNLLLSAAGLGLLVLSLAAAVHMPRQDRAAVSPGPTLQTS